MRDVAERAGVSLKTVSRALNGEPGVHPETSARVLQAADELRFRRNESAATLRRSGQGTRSIGLVIDFVGPALDKLGADAKVEGVVSVDGNGELLERTTYRNEVTGGWRVSLRLKRVDDGKPVELRACLKGDNNTLSETWSYVLPPG